MKEKNTYYVITYKNTVYALLIWDSIKFCPPSSSSYLLSSLHVTNVKWIRIKNCLIKVNGRGIDKFIAVNASKSIFIAQRRIKGALELQKSNIGFPSTSRNWFSINTRNFLSQWRFINLSLITWHLISPTFLTPSSLK